MIVYSLIILRVETINLFFTPVCHVRTRMYASCGYGYVIMLIHLLFRENRHICVINNEYNEPGIDTFKCLYFKVTI